DRYRRLLTLELVDSPDTRARNRAPEQPDLRVVRRHYQHVGEAQRLYLAPAIPPLLMPQRRNKSRNGHGFFNRGSSVAGVLDRNEADANLPGRMLQVAAFRRLQPAFVSDV